MNMMFIFIGGGLGALCRFFLSSHISGQFQTRFPLGTFVVNIVGCFLIGFTIMAINSKDISRWVTVFCVTGFLGAFTTFSTYGLEIIQLMKAREYLLAFLTFFLSNVAGIICVFLGMLCAENLLNQ